MVAVTSACTGSGAISIAIAMAGAGRAEKALGAPTAAPAADAGPIYAHIVTQVSLGRIGLERPKPPALNILLDTLQHSVAS